MQVFISKLEIKKTQALGTLKTLSGPAVLLPGGNSRKHILCCGTFHTHDSLAHLGEVRIRLAQPRWSASGKRTGSGEKSRHFTSASRNPSPEAQGTSWLL